MAKMAKNIFKNNESMVAVVGIFHVNFKLYPVIRKVESRIDMEILSRRVWYLFGESHFISTAFILIVAH